MTKKPDDYYTPKEFAEKYKLHECTLRRWRMQGKGPPFDKIGDGPLARVRYPKKEADDFATRRRR